MSEAPFDRITELAERLLAKLHDRIDDVFTFLAALVAVFDSMVKQPAIIVERIETGASSGMHFIVWNAWGIVILIAATVVYHAHIGKR